MQSTSAIFYALGLPAWGQLQLDYVSYAWFLSLCLLETTGHGDKDINYLMFAPFIEVIGHDCVLP